MATTKPGPAPDEEPTIGRLVADTTRDLSSLIRNEIQLAKTELKFSVQAGGLGAALFAAAAFLVLLAIVMISIAFGCSWTGWTAGPATAFLIVFGVYVLIAGSAGVHRLKKFKKVKAPEQTIAAMKSNKQILKRG